MAILESYIEALREWLALPSVSTDPAFQPDVERAASWLADRFRSNSFTVETWRATGLNPVVLAHYEVAAAAPTVLVYGHYDVQPAALEDGWSSPPFELTERDGRLYGRGVVDNKGQVLVHIATVIQLIADGTLACNVKFLIEGNEETGSQGLAALLTKHHKALACDHVVVSDGEIPYRPTLEASLRGGFNLRVRYQTATGNQHSGIYGGAIPNAAHELSRLLGSLYGQDRRVTVPNFYDGVDTPAAAEAADRAALSPSLEYLRQTTGVRSTLLPEGLDFATATGLQPTLQVSGIVSGYTGEGFANIIPAVAEARINVRTAPSQSTAQVQAALTTFIREQTPDYVDCELTVEMPVDAIKLPTDSATARHVQRLLEQAYGQRPLISHSGGSIPIVSDFKEILGRDALLISLGNDDCNMHGPNENFDIELLKKGLAFSQLFFSQNLPK